jgi:hypothetical protein
MTLRWPWFAAFAVFVACIPLFAVDHYFYGDWPNHLGMIGYFGAYLRAHGALPATMHTVQTVGRSTTIFYGGTSFLPLLGTLSAFFGPWGAVSLGVAGLLFLQFASVRALLWDVTRDEVVSCAAATIATWAIYPLTDLYNRAAIPEFFAITALQTGTCLWILYARDPARHARASVGAGLLVAYGAGVHPPSALFGCLTFAVVWLASLVWCPDRRSLLKRSLAIGAAMVVVLAPWLYALGKFKSHLRIVKEAEFLFYLTSLDAVSTRLSLVPTVGPDAKVVLCPSLDPQISVPIAAAAILLGLVALETLARDRQARRALAFAGVLAATTCALFALSTKPSAWKLVPKGLQAIQFPYRLVAFVNVAALATLTGVLAAFGRERSYTAGTRLVLALALGVAALGVGLKLPRCLGPGGGADAVVTDYVSPPGDWYYGLQDYATPDAFPQLPGGVPKQAVSLPVGRGGDFAVVGTVTVRLATPMQIGTNVQAFPWNVLTIDGRPLPHEATFADGFKLGAFVEAGVHVIGYEFHPDGAWSALRALSLLLLVAWAGTWAFGPALTRVLARRRAAAALEVRPS